MIDCQLHLLSASRLPTSYPLQLAADEVAAWLNGYAALWHPAALLGATQPPQASTSYDHDLPKTGYIYCTPKGPHLFQPDDWRERVVRVAATVFDASADRAETQQNLLAALREREQKASEGQSGANARQTLLDLPVEVVRDFRGLGYGYLLLDNLYEAADHQRLLDAEGFWLEVTAAVRSLTTLESLESKNYRDHLRAAAEKLQTAREQLHSQRMFWVDFVALNPEKPDALWPESLALGLPLCVTASAETLERFAEQSPERFAKLKAKLSPDLPTSIDLCCGAYREREDALLPPESQWWNLAAARETARKLLGVEPAVYARKVSAFHPQLPGWLQHLGYRHAVLSCSGRRPHPHHSLDRCELARSRRQGGRCLLPRTAPCPRPAVVLQPRLPHVPGVRVGRRADHRPGP